MMYVVKKDGTKEDFDVQKIVRAVNKSASRIMYNFKEDEVKFICRYAQEKADSLDKEEISIQDMHNIVEGLWKKSIHLLQRATEIIAIISMTLFI